MKNKLLAGTIIIATFLMIRFILPSRAQVATHAPATFGESVTNRVASPDAASGILPTWAADHSIVPAPAEPSIMAEPSVATVTHEDNSPEIVVAGSLAAIPNGPEHVDSDFDFPVTGGQQVIRNPFVQREKTAGEPSAAPDMQSDAAAFHAGAGPMIADSLSMESMVATLFPGSDSDSATPQFADSRLQGHRLAQFGNDSLPFPTGNPTPQPDIPPTLPSGEEAQRYAPTGEGQLESEAGANADQPLPPRRFQRESAYEPHRQSMPSHNVRPDALINDQGRTVYGLPGDRAPQSVNLVDELSSLSRQCESCKGGGCQSCLSRLLRRRARHDQEPVDWQRCRECRGDGCRNCSGSGYILPGPGNEPNCSIRESTYNPSCGISDAGNNPSCGISDPPAWDVGSMPMRDRFGSCPSNRLAGLGQLPSMLRRNRSRLCDEGDACQAGRGACGCNRCGPQGGECEQNYLWDSWECEAQGPLVSRPQHIAAAGRDSQCNQPGPVASLRDRVLSFEGFGERGCAGDSCEGCTSCEPLFGGWLSAGTYDNSHGLAGNTGNSPLAFNNLAEELQLHQAWLHAGRKAKTGGNLNFGFRMDVVFGTDGPNTQAFGDSSWDQKWDTSREYGWALPQLYVEAAWQDFKVTVGHFYSIIGYEVVQAPNNFFYSHSYTFSYNEPFTNTGVLLKSELNERTTLYSGWTAGWDTGFSNGNNGSTFLGGIGFAPTDDVSLIYALSFGDPGDDPIRSSDTFLQSVVMDWHVSDRVEYVFQSDFQTRDSQTLGGKSYGVVNYLFYELTESLKIGARYEWFRDSRGVNAIAGASEHFHALTFGLNQHLSDNIVIRPEIRYDWVDRDDVFGAGGPFANGTKRSQFTFGWNGYVVF